jgi:hypothetical protein
MGIDLSNASLEQNTLILLIVQPSFNFIFLKVQVVVKL